MMYSETNPIEVQAGPVQDPARPDAGQARMDTSPRLVIRGETLVESATAHIDWFAFTFIPPPDTDNRLMAWLLQQFFEIFGIPVFTAIASGGGWNGYDHCVKIGDNGQYGRIGYGGKSQRGTVHVELNGTACARINSWSNVQEWGRSLNIKITRVDLAHDDFEALIVNIRVARAWHEAGAFSTNGRPPAARFIDDLGSNNGKTLYIGKRANGKLLRIYEKGKQLGDPTSLWVRVELELRNKGRLIPLDILTNPSDYLAGGYPCLTYLSARQEKIRTVRKYVQISLDAGKEYLRIVGGKWLNVLMQAHGGDACAVISDLVRPGVPRRLENYEDFLPEVFGGGHAVDPQ